MLIDFEVIREAFDELTVSGKHVADELSSLLGQLGLNDPPVLRRPLPEHEPLCFQPIHHIGDVASRYEQFVR